MTTVTYLVGAANETYGADAIAYVRQFAEPINNVATQLGISAGAIAGAMAEERQAYDSMDSSLDKYAQSGFNPTEAILTLPAALAGGADAMLVWVVTHATELATTRTHAQWEALFPAAHSFVGKPSASDKVFNPALIDVGLGNFKIATAIDIVVKYAAKYPDLGLSRYLTHYDLLVADLMSETSTLTAALYGIYIKEYAEPFFRNKSAYAGQWDSLPQTFRDALLVSYTNLGESAMLNLMKTPYEPQPALTSGGGMNHLLNASAIGSALGLSGYGSDAIGVADFIAQAKTSGEAGLAARYALSELRYVSISGLDYSSKNINGALSLVAEGGDITDSWIEDRARLLVTLTKISVKDSGASTWLNDPSALGDRDLVFHYFDPKDGTEKTAGLSLDGAPRADQEIFFGSASADTLSGTSNKFGDHLYGDAGNDSLSGLGGDDYLEGNVDNDTLIGGEGRDTLVGGAGADRYEFSGGFGADTVIDADGNGSLWVDGVQLTGGELMGAGVWKAQGEGAQWMYIQSGDDLLIQKAGVDGSLVIKGWSTLSGAKLGLNLEQPDAAAQAGALVGDYAVKTEVATNDLKRTNPDSKEKVVVVSAGSLTYKKDSQGNLQYAEGVGPTSFTFDDEGNMMSAHQPFLADRTINDSAWRRAA